MSFDVLPLSVYALVTLAFHQVGGEGEGGSKRVRVCVCVCERERERERENVEFTVFH